MGDELRRRFVRVPVEAMQSCVDRLDLRISGEVASALAEDASFRIRQIADVRSLKLHSLGWLCRWQSVLLLVV